MKHRSSFAISMLILEKAASDSQAGVSKTKMIQYLVLERSCVERYCNLLEFKGLIYRDPQDHWHTTKKGLELLANCYQLANLLKPIKNLVDKYSINTDDNTISYLPY